MPLASRDVYAGLSLAQVPRILGNQDRNAYSPTYGCFHRDYWLDKTSDFPDAVRQFAVHSLALVYACDFPGNVYRGNPKVREWAIAGMDFWAGIQHKDGTFDEFYPYERGWVGPTGFTAFAVTEAFRLLESQMPVDVAGRVRGAIGRAARSILQGQAEEDHLANHHAMACLAVWKAYELLGESELEIGFDKIWQVFLSYHDAQEGWSREYDGADPGYLSAVVSFLAKIYKTKRDPELLNVLAQAVDFCSYFAYPNGSYGGSIGSRNTVHLYPHGFEVLAKEVPMAAAVAERALAALQDGKLVPPGIMSDRYVGYRVPEFLEAYLDYTTRPDPLPPLPYQSKPFRKYFSGARVYVAADMDSYLVANLAKGGVVKMFDRRDGHVLINDSGMIGSLAGGELVTTQWIDEGHQVKVTEDGWQVSGSFNLVAANKMLTPPKNILFRVALVLLGWNPRFSHWLKGAIRRALMLGSRPVPVRFSRQLVWDSDGPVVQDEVRLERGRRFDSLAFGDEFFVRYVPQSRYFQSQELECRGLELSEAELQGFNRSGAVCIRAKVSDGVLNREVLAGND